MSINTICRIATVLSMLQGISCLDDASSGQTTTPDTTDSAIDADDSNDATDVSDSSDASGGVDTFDASDSISDVDTPADTDASTFCTYPGILERVWSRSTGHPVWVVFRDDGTFVRRALGQDGVCHELAWTVTCSDVVGTGNVELSSCDNESLTLEISVTNTLVINGVDYIDQGLIADELISMGCENNTECTLWEF